MTEPTPAAARREITEDLRRARHDEHPVVANLVPVEGGEPMPAEDPPAERSEAGSWA